jgi:hypothetical protein
MNSTPHSARLGRDEMHQLLTGMALAALSSLYERASAGGD